jgi:hypothetical protein
VPRPLLAILLLLGCEDIPVGSVGWECPNDNNCLPGLSCIDGECAMVPDTGVTPVRDAGPIAPDAAVDAGVDAGNDPPDAGEEDTGPICPVPPELDQIQSQIFGANGQASCNEAACHGQSAAGGLQLTLPADQLRQRLLGDTTDPNAPQRKLVVPGDPAQSRLYVIVSTRAPGGTGGPMPPIAPLDACDVSTIRRWIENGAP